MSWNKEQIKYHIRASKLLYEIIIGAFDYIRKNKENVSERDVQNFIHNIRKHGLKRDGHKMIVAFNESAATPHYFVKGKGKKLRKNSLILIDIWARLDKRKAPYADITWIGYYGNKVPRDIRKVFYIVIKARDNCLKYIGKGLRKKRMPVGKECDKIARDLIANYGYGKNFIHSTGHSIGYTSPHGILGGLRKSNKKKLLRNLGYTIEPGIYLKNKFGIRSEIDFYINKNMKLIVTTPVQSKIVRV